jgi:hypothetical protein
MRKVRLLFFTVGIFFSFASFSQSVTPFILNSTGGTNMYTFYRFEWSFGEMLAIETMSTPTLQVTNGLLQPGTSFPAAVNNTSAWGADEIKILPNPTRDWLEIDFFSKQQGKVTMSVYDESGRLMGKTQFDYFGVGQIRKWSFINYASGTYFLNIQLQPTGTSVGKNSTFTVQKAR